MKIYKCLLLKYDKYSKSVTSVLKYYKHSMFYSICYKNQLGIHLYKF